MEGKFHHDRKEDAKQGLGKYAALLYTIVDVKCLGGRAIKLNEPFHVCVKRPGEGQELQNRPSQLRRSMAMVTSMKEGRTVVPVLCTSLVVGVGRGSC